jgi:predicted MFS family arabinose efflux permease
MAAGGLGALAATVPVEWGLQYVDWQALFWLLGGLSVLAAVQIWLAVPEKMGGSGDGDTSLAAQLRDYWTFLLDARFLKIAPVSVVGMGSGMSIQTLWTGPFLRDAGGLDQAHAAQIQFLLAVALTAGFMLTGILADRLQRFGVTLAQTMIWSTALYVVCLGCLAAGLFPASPLLWIAFGLICLTTVLAYPIVSADFPVEKSGRVNALLNAVVFGLTFVIQAGTGWVIDLWPKGADGHYPAAAYQWSFGILAVLLAVTLVWYAIPVRRPRD